MYKVNIDTMRMEDKVKQSLAKYIGRKPGELTCEYEGCYTLGEQEYYVFENEDKAYEYALEDYGPEYCNGAVSDEEWYAMIWRSCNGDEETMNCCFPKGKDEQPDYKEITRHLLNKEGIAWFLSSYDGNSMFLDYENYVAYRRN